MKMPSRKIRQNVIRAARRVVVKVGTNAICDPSGRPQRGVISRLAGQIVKLSAEGRQFVVVSSGAIGAGMGELALSRRPSDLPKLQACAAVGQGQLMRIFHDTFARRGVRVGQVLVTREDFENRTRYLNIRNTLQALREAGAVPIINENDVVAVDEIRYGDNDIIAAHVSNMMCAEVLVLLSNVDGVIRSGEVVDLIEETEQAARQLDSGAASRFGSGGLSSKLAAVGMVTSAGEAAVIANARCPNVLVKILSGRKIGTVFLPAEKRLSSRRRWIGQASRPAGRIYVDRGAVAALKERGKSLLPSGITDVSGNFTKGAIIIIVDAEGGQIARGLTNYSADEVRKIMGKKTSQLRRILTDAPYQEVIHRNNMTLL